MVALGKVFLFKECWEYLSKRARKDVRQKKLEGLRVALRERINNLPDDLFFVPPERAASEEEVKEYLQQQFETQKLKDKILKELQKRIESSEPGLGEFV